ncbi:MAG: ParB/RepB/Spo0J family partition protein [Candidatus Niyogibacteria bacterium]|nr:ParB/RepB/Spo0J family partition protein [Candidatus Niyogibacteria bacterium]
MPETAERPTLQKDLLPIGSVGEVLPKKVRPFKGQPRTNFDEDKMNGLTESIKTVGQRHPAEVYRLPADPVFDYQLVDGERRQRACLILERPFLVMVVPARPERELFIASAVSNCQREDLAPLETARALARIMKENPGMTQNKAAGIFGKSQKWVSQYLSLLTLHPEIQKMLEPDAPKEKRLSHLVGFAIATTSDQEEQICLAETILEERMKYAQAVAFIRDKVRGLKPEQIRRKRERSPKDDYRLLESFMYKTGEGFDLRAKRLFARLSVLFEHRDPGDLTWALHKAGELEKNFAELKEKLQKLQKASENGH